MDTTNSPTTITVAKQSNLRIAISVALLVFLPVLGIPALSLPGTTGPILFAVTLVLGFALFIWGIVKWVNTYPTLGMSDTAIIEYDDQGRETTIPFSDFKNFGYIRSGGNYWIRFKLRSTGRSYRYSPRKRKKEIVEEFRTFASQLNTAVAQYNSHEFAPSAGATIERPIEIGLSKPEKATNVLGLIYRVIIYLVLVIFSFGLLAEPGISRTIGFVLLAWLLIAPPVFFFRARRKRRKAKRSQTQVLASEAGN